MYLVLETWLDSNSLCSQSTLDCRFNCGSNLFIYLFIINTVQTSIREYKAQIHARKQNVQHFRLYSWVNTKIVYNPFLKVIYIGCFNCSSWEAVPYFDSGREY